MVHIYHGDGKGKTTAAMGQALRALGPGWHVGVVQFLKDGSSGEVRMLASLPRTSVVACSTDGKFTFQMTSDELAAMRTRQEEALARARAQAEAGEFDLLVLDEVLDAVNTDTLAASSVEDAVHACKPSCELVLTGRDPAPALLELADYVTEMRCEKHPYQQGVAAREGVEW